VKTIKAIDENQVIQYTILSLGRCNCDFAIKSLVILALIR